ncbi:hypothetical protein N7493_004027 [Penicillium malachiteum]|uniref:Xylanolytic transcriptional activator regulatory domain-containing protein n=1 Tax=Penicillium malachiteum TaxID=1324776 RepID=A0AAD6MY78_9EURO|nr:hypothetical protein N7493_004027 [Penicillium malachiteum]
MKPCEIELRKRLWWWIYSFDSVTSLIHGLPSLINDVDVDCDMPTDCHMDDLDAAELSHPLPGERTAIFLFIQYVALGKLLSRIRETLYTTTQRRNGATKINDLNLDLRMWNQILKTTGIIFDIGTIPSPLLRNESAYENDRTVLWLQLLANTAMGFINRPGLSFDDTTVEFANCLRACVASSTANLSLLKEIHVPTWLRNMSLVSPEGCPALEASMDMISHAIFVLEKDRTDFQHIHVHQSFYHQSINEAIGTLQLLRSLLSTPEHIPACTEVHIDQAFVDQTPRTFDDQSWGANALDDLNYVLATDWMYEVPEPFMGCMDLGAPEFG